MTRQEMSGGFGWDRRRKRTQLAVRPVVEVLPIRVLLSVLVGERESNIPAYVTAAFQTAYNRMTNWGERNSVYLGSPVNKVHWWGQGYIQDFRGGRYGDGAIMMAEDGSTAYAIWGKMWELYRQQPMQATNPPSAAVDWLGYPTTDHYNPSAAEAGQLNWYQGSGAPADLRQGSVIRFQSGYITFKEGTPFAWWTRTAPAWSSAWVNSLNLTVRSSSQIDLTWRNAVGEDGYRIYKWKDARWLQIGSVGRDVTSFSVRNLPAATGQFFYVEAFNTVGSISTNWKFATTLAGQTAPSSPGPLTLTVRSSSQIDLAWTNSNGEDGYNIYRWDGVTPWKRIATVGRDVTSYSVKNLPANADQFFYVDAFNSVGSTSAPWKAARIRYFVEDIPDFMDSRGWRVSAALQREWFSKPAKEAGSFPDFRLPIDSSTVTMSWILRYQRARDAYTKLVNYHYFLDPAAKDALRSHVASLFSVTNASTVYFDYFATTGLGRHSQQIQYSKVDYGYGNDDLAGSLGNFSLYLIPKGYATKTSTGFKVTITAIGVYALDSYEFQPKDQPLGLWGPLPTSVWNSSYRTFRDATGRGGDFLVMSDVRVTTLQTPQTVNV